MSSNDCPCNGTTLERFLRPTVMAVLARHPEGLHGYRIAQALSEIAIFEQGPPDSAGMYRILKTMEAEGYLRSEWDTDGGGPAKRVYTLTPDGLECLTVWASTLESYLEILGKTVRFIKESRNLPEMSPFR